MIYSTYEFTYNTKQIMFLAKKIVDGTFITKLIFGYIQQNGHRIHCRSKKKNYTNAACNLHHIEKKFHLVVMLLF